MFVFANTYLHAKLPVDLRLTVANTLLCRAKRALSLLSRAASAMLRYNIVGSL